MSEILFALFWLMSGLIFGLIWHIKYSSYTLTHQFQIDMLDLYKFDYVSRPGDLRKIALKLKYAEWILLSYIALVMFFMNKHRPMKGAPIFYIKRNRDQV
jgi:hypothetical protein